MPQPNSRWINQARKCCVCGEPVQPGQLYIQFGRLGDQTTTWAHSACWWPSQHRSAANAPEIVRR